MKRFTEFEDLIRRQVRALGVSFSVNERAPSTFEDLKRECSERSLVIWSGGSENTIYGAPSTNYLFRAWHDALHLKLNAPFTLEGEIYVAREQARNIGDLAGDVIIAEVQGQAEYFAKHGVFPSNQVEFVLNYLKHGRLK